MKTTIELNEIIPDQEIKTLLLEQLNKEIGEGNPIQDIYDILVDNLKVTVDWDIELYKKDLSQSSRFGGYNSYAYLNIFVKSVGECEIPVQYYITEDDRGDITVLKFKVYVELGNVNNSKLQHNVIQPNDAELDFAHKEVIVNF